jgi:hypothetical protein
MQGLCNNFHHGFLAILKNALNDGEERAGWPHPHPEGLLERMGWGYAKSHGQGVLGMV